MLALRSPALRSANVVSPIWKPAIEQSLSEIFFANIILEKIDDDRESNACGFGKFDSSIPISYGSSKPT
jgi:hypothetical protein